LSPDTDKTNNKGFQLLQLVGVDGSLRTYCQGYALLMSSTTEVCTWLFGCLRDLAGQDACNAVHWMLADDDGALQSAMDQVRN
jgi:hypothetical protein